MAYLFIEAMRPNAALVSDTIFLFANDKLVQMAICPTHYHLHGFVKCPDGRVTRNQDASPNCWLNVSQNYLKLKVSVLPSTRLTSRQSAMSSALLPARVVCGLVVFNFHSPRDVSPPQRSLREWRPSNHILRIRSRSAQGSAQHPRPSLVEVCSRPVFPPPERIVPVSGS
jgi:hypothetical protein